MRQLFHLVAGMLRSMVGAGDYGAYLHHMRAHHPGMPPLDRTQFFRDRQQARYGGKNGGKCC
jgi:uncharacterized short protein YbdD (DUF466 family)